MTCKACGYCDQKKYQPAELKRLNSDMPPHGTLKFIKVTELFKVANIGTLYACPVCKTVRLDD